MSEEDTARPSLAIIPARGGSKRIPRKNIRLFRGKPMIAWSVEAALASGAFDDVMVSTDDAEIAETARALGVEVPFLRSARTADDHATTADVLTEVLDVYAGLGRAFPVACCLYPTAPFVRPEDLAAGKAKLLNGPFDVIMPVTAFGYPIWRSLHRDGTGRISLNFPEHLNARSQDLPPAYHDAGQWYWFRVPAFRRSGTLLGPNTGSVLLSEAKVQDIDTEEDWALAEMKHERMFR
jgi:pseudaminic acid cytidylyltransferase